MQLGHFLAFLAASLWGLTYCLDQKVLGEISVYKLYFLHCLFGAILSGGIWFFQGNGARELFALASGKLSPSVLILTLAVGAAAGISIFSSIQILGASTAAILEISYPLFVVLFGYAFFEGSVSYPVILGGMFIFLGSSIIVLWNH